MAVTNEQAARLRQRIHLAELVDSMRRLGANLAQAAALCWAFELGDAYARRHLWDGPGPWSYWQPGCGRDAK